MPITFPLAQPAALRTAKVIFTARRASSAAESPFTFHRQRYHHPGERLELSVECPPQADNDFEAVIAWLLCAGRGTVWFGDPAHPLPRGTVSGGLTVGSGCAANSINLPLAGGVGTFAPGDWLQIGGSLHKVIHVDSATAVQVFPRLRAAHASGTAVIYHKPAGLFHLRQPAVNWELDVARRSGLTFDLIEAVGANTTPTYAT